ncbi:MAG: hypothetical protein PVH68_08245, partial [Armatimonadota bacterium]
IGSAAGRSQETQPEVTERPGVRLLYDEGVDWTYAEIIVEVVSAAKQAYETLFPAAAKQEIQVHVRQARDWFESVVTDREDEIHVYLGPKGMGEHFRADAGPVGILCIAVAELYNPRRVPGLDRYLAHRHLVPAVGDATGLIQLLQSSPTAPADDGAPMMALMAQPEYAAVHPDFAAAAALAAIEEKLGLEGLQRLIAGLPAAAGDPLAAIRQTATAQSADLAAAFVSCDRANALALEADGTCLIASFGGDEPLTRVPNATLATLSAPLPLRASMVWGMSRSNEWATDGRLSLKLHARDRTRWGELSIHDPDWRFKDWRRFSKFEMDLKFVSAAPQRIRVFLHDDVGYSHGTVLMFEAIVQPGESHHIEYALDPDALKGQPAVRARYFGGFRAGEVAGLEVIMDDAPPPMTLYIDNLRLTPRGA